VAAHRHAYAPMASGHHVDHLCNDRWCVRPSNLEVVSPEENTRRSGMRWHRRLGWPVPPDWPSVILRCPVPAAWVERVRIIDRVMARHAEATTHVGKAAGQQPEEADS
jgi:HNH endonuclease